MCDGEVIGPEHLAEEVVDQTFSRMSSSPASLSRWAPDSEGVVRGHPAEGESVLDLEQVQREALLQVVRHHHGSRRDLARKLGLSERTLYRRLRALGVDDTTA